MKKIVNNKRTVSPKKKDIKTSTAGHSNQLESVGQTIDKLETTVHTYFAQLKAREALNEKRLFKSLKEFKGWTDTAQITGMLFELLHDSLNSQIDGEPCPPKGTALTEILFTMKHLIMLSANISKCSEYINIKYNELNPDRVS